MSNTARTPLVEMRDISIAFGGVKAVDHVSIDLYPGEVVGLLGHNGAGKSTLIKILAGAYQADAGDILINGALKPEVEIRAVFDKAGVDLLKPIINTCGSGVTAAILTLAQSLLGHDDAAVYDGSWSEWGMPDSGGAVVTG